MALPCVVRKVSKNCVHQKMLVCYSHSKKDVQAPRNHWKCPTRAQHQSQMNCRRPPLPACPGPLGASADLHQFVAPANLGSKNFLTFFWSWCNQGYVFFSLTSSRSAVDSHSVISHNSHHLSRFLSGGLFTTAINLKIMKGFFTSLEFSIM